MQDLAFKCWMKAQVAKQQFKDGVKDFFCEEGGGSDSLIIAIVLIVIVIAIAIIFKDQIASWVNDLFGAANADIDESMKDPNISTY